MIQEHVAEILGKIREPLALDRWTIKPEVGPIEDGGGRAFCMASPEYSEALIKLDLDRLETGDDATETVVHEATHCHTWPLHALAEELAKLAAKQMGSPALEAFLLEQVRLAGEKVTTDVGHTYLRLLRRAGVLDTPAPTP